MVLACVLLSGCGVLDDGRPTTPDLSDCEVDLADSRDTMAAISATAAVVCGGGDMDGAVATLCSVAPLATALSELMANVDPQDCETARDMERVVVHSQEAFEAAARVVARAREVTHAGQGDRGSGMPDAGPHRHDMPAGQEGGEALGEGSETPVVAEPDAPREAEKSEGMERAE